MHRLGQTRTVYVRRLIARDSVEEAILRIQASKQALAASALNPTAAAGEAAHLSEADFKLIFHK